jgi:hypothetical protein
MTLQSSSQRGLLTQTRTAGHAKPVCITSLTSFRYLTNTPCSRRILFWSSQLYWPTLYDHWMCLPSCTSFTAIRDSRTRRPQDETACRTKASFAKMDARLYCKTDKCSCTPSPANVMRSHTSTNTQMYKYKKSRCGQAISSPQASAITLATFLLAEPRPMAVAIPFYTFLYLRLLFSSWI